MYQPIPLRTQAVFFGRRSPTVGGGGECMPTRTCIHLYTARRLTFHENNTSIGRRECEVTEQIHDHCEIDRRTTPCNSNMGLALSAAFTLVFRAPAGHRTTALAALVSLFPLFPTCIAVARCRWDAARVKAAARLLLLPLLCRRGLHWRHPTADRGCDILAASATNSP